MRELDDLIDAAELDAAVTESNRYASPGARPSPRDRAPATGADAGSMRASAGAPCTAPV